MFYIDSHCHINDASYKDDIEQVYQNMKDSNVLKAMIVSTSPEDFYRSLALECNGLSFKHSIGVYPEDCQISEERFNEFVSLMKDERCKAIGEIGLDYHWYKDTREQQMAMFDRQLALAEELNKPVIIHSREAMQDTYDILSTHKVRGVIHCYSGSYEMAERFLKLGFYISFAGTITYKNAKEPLRAVKAVPLNRILTETDSPYLTPAPKRGQRNEPANVVFTAEKVLSEMGVDRETFLKAVDMNYEELFS